MLLDFFKFCFFYKEKLEMIVFGKEWVYWIVMKLEMKNVE